MILEIIISILISYLLGSLSPGYFFGKLNDIDIRKFGNKNTGAANVYRVISPKAGIITAIIDIVKGSLAFLISNFILQIPDAALFLSFFAVIGHNYPFYLKFRGGKGAATSWGIALASLFFTQSLLAFLVVLYVIVFSFAISRKLEFNKPSRKILRAAALIFPLWYFFFGQKQALIIISIALILFLLLDIVRLSSEKLNAEVFKRLKGFIKRKEKKLLSTTTLFLLSSTLVIALFPMQIAFISILFFLVGDTMAEVFGRVYKKWKIGKKSLEGSAFGFGFNFLIGIFLIGPLNLTLIFIIKAALFSAVIELASQKIDDNLTMPIGTAILLRIFG